MTTTEERHRLRWWLAGQVPDENTLRRNRAEIEKRVRQERRMPASPIAEAVILAHDVHAKDKEDDGRKTLDVIGFESGIAQFHGGDEFDVARVWLRRLAKDPANLDVLLERFSEALVQSLLDEQAS